MATCDLDGDGKREHVLVYSEEKHISGDNPGTEKGSPTVRHNFNVSVVLLDADLRPIARHLLANRIENSPSYSVWAGQLEPGQPNRILVFGEQVKELEFIPADRP
jgi:hypothetical protein